MKYIFVMITFITMSAGVVYGDAFFIGQPLSQLRVTRVNIQDNTAQMADTNGVTAQVGIGDTIGQPAATILTISELFVGVKTEQGTTKIPVVRGTNLGDHRIGFH